MGQTQTLVLTSPPWKETGQQVVALVARSPYQFSNPLFPQLACKPGVCQDTFRDRFNAIPYDPIQLRMILDQSINLLYPVVVFLLSQSFYRRGFISDLVSCRRLIIIALFDSILRKGRGEKQSKKKSLGS